MESDLTWNRHSGDHDGDGLLTIDELAHMGQIHMIGTPIAIV